MNEQESNVLKKIIKSEHLNDLFAIELTQEYEKMFLYPTNDLWLTEKQYEILKDFLKTIGENEFYLTQFDGGSVKEKFSSLFSKYNPVYKFNLETDYTEYCQPFFYSVSVLFSLKGTWAILIDESFYAGYGILIVSKENIVKFKKLYESLSNDFNNYMKDEIYLKENEYYKSLLISNGIIKETE